MHVSTRLIEMLSHDPLMFIFCGVMAFLIANVSGMWFAVWLMNRLEGRRHNGR